MPRSIKSEIETSDFKPYSKTSESPATKPGSPTKGKPWTSTELVQLFEHVTKHGTQSGSKGWAVAVEGRSGNQCYQAWLTTAPFLKKALEERGKKAIK